MLRAPASARRSRPSLRLPPALSGRNCSRPPPARKSIPEPAAWSRIAAPVVALVDVREQGRRRGVPDLRGAHDAGQATGGARDFAEIGQRLALRVHADAPVQGLCAGEERGGARVRRTHPAVDGVSGDQPGDRKALKDERVEMPRQRHWPERHRRRRCGRPWSGRCPCRRRPSARRDEPVDRRAVAGRGRWPGRYLPARPTLRRSWAAARPSRGPTTIQRHPPQPPPAIPPGTPHSSPFASIGKAIASAADRSSPVDRPRRHR